MQLRRNTGFRRLCLLAVLENANVAHGHQVQTHGSEEKLYLWTTAGGSLLNDGQVGTSCLVTPFPSQLYPASGHKLCEEAMSPNVQNRKASRLPQRPRWLQPFVLTKQQRTRLDTFNQQIRVFRQLIGQSARAWLVEPKPAAALAFVEEFGLEMCGQCEALTWRWCRSGSAFTALPGCSVVWSGANTREYST